MAKIPFQEAVRNASSQKVAIVGPLYSGKTTAAALWLADRNVDGLSCAAICSEYEWSHICDASGVEGRLQGCLRLDPLRKSVTGYTLEAIAVGGNDFESGFFFRSKWMVDLLRSTPFVCVYGGPQVADPGMGIGFEVILASRISVAQATGLSSRQPEWRHGSPTR